MKNKIISSLLLLPILLVFLSSCGQEKINNIDEELLKEKVKNELLEEFKKHLNDKNSPQIGHAKNGIFDIYEGEKFENFPNFDDIHGIEEAKSALKEIIFYLTDPVNFARFGANPSKGVIFYGPPGTGKTAIARAMAKEVSKNRDDIVFIKTSGSQFDLKYVGVGADNVRNLFSLAMAYSKNKKFVIIFIDELDSLVGKRSDSDKNTQTVNQFLNELDGFEKNENIFIICATNRLDNIDEAAQRAGRLDLKIKIDLPNREGRRGILEIYLGKKGYEITGIDMDSILDITEGFSGADLEALVEQARRAAALRPEATKVEMEDFIDAAPRIKPKKG